MGNSGAAVLICVECGREMRPQRTPRDGRPRYAGRGLCEACHSLARRHGRLDEYPRTNRPISDTLDDVRWVGLDERLPLAPQFRAIAERLGLTESALEQAYYRSKRREQEAA